MIASLPMYWRAENAHIWKALWGKVQASGEKFGVSLPDLTPPEDLPSDWAEHWTSPDLALSMTCGLPFRTALKDRVTYVGTLDFGLPGLPAGHYASVEIAAKTAHPTSNLTLAYNAADSQSGWAAAQPGPWTQLIETGAHAASLAAVARGEADRAFLDIVTWRLLQRFDPLAAQVEVVRQTPPTPALPLICARGIDPAPLRRALATALDQTSTHDAEMVGGTRLSLVTLSPKDYVAVPNPPPPAPKTAT